MHIIHNFLTLKKLSYYQHHIILFIIEGMFVYHLQNCTAIFNYFYMFILCKGPLKCSRLSYIFLRNDILDLKMWQEKAAINEQLSKSHLTFIELTFPNLLCIQFLNRCRARFQKPKNMPYCLKVQRKLFKLSN